jgi:hypothetical protein
MTDTYGCRKNKSYHTSTDDYQPDSETTLGGYATKLVVRQEFALSIPDSLSMEQAVRRHSNHFAPFPSPLHTPHPAPRNAPPKSHRDRIVQRIALWRRFSSNKPGCLLARWLPSRTMRFGVTMTPRLKNVCVRKVCVWGGTCASWHKQKTTTLTTPLRSFTTDSWHMHSGSDPVRRHHCVLAYEDAWFGRGRLAWHHWARWSWPHGREDWQGSWARDPTTVSPTDTSVSSPKPSISFSQAFTRIRAQRSHLRAGKVLWYLYL